MERIVTSVNEQDVDDEDVVTVDGIVIPSSASSLLTLCVSSSIDSFSPTNGIA